MGVAVVANTRPTELDPLYESVEPDALNHLFNQMTGEPPQHDGGRITFIFEECKVTVYSDGTIEITPLDVSEARGPTDA